MAIASINPTTGELLETFPETSGAELERILGRAVAAFRDWSRCPVAARTSPLGEAARLLRERKGRYARTMALEMGKPLAQGEAEAEKCAWACDYYAEHAEQFLSPVARPTDATRSYVRFDALGPVLAIMPWNFPFWQVFRFAAPALAAGNAGLLKHAPNVSRCALEIEQLLREAGFPDGLFRAVLLPNEAVAPVIADPRICAVTLTGSDRAGSQVAQQAGRHLKKTVLELGGSEEPVFDRFLERFVAAVAARRLGDPLAAGTDVGPQARADLRANLQRQVEESVRRGAKLVLGGRVPEGPGFFYPPSVLTSVANGMPAFDEEVFGPVAAVIRVRDDADAVRVANASPYGLGAAVWTEDRERGERLAAELEVGSVFVNGLVKSDPRLPFGGVKRSGYGRELSEFGLREFVNVKSVWVG